MTVFFKIFFFNHQGKNDFVGFQILKKSINLTVLLSIFELDFINSSIIQYQIEAFAVCLTTPKTTTKIWFHYANRKALN